MSVISYCFASLVSLSCLTTAWDEPATPPAAVSTVAPKTGDAAWTADALQNKWKELEADPKLPDEKKKKAVELFKQAATAAKSAADWRQRAESLKTALADAPKNIESLKQKLASPAVDPMVGAADRTVKGLTASANAFKLRQAEFQKAGEEAEAAIRARSDRRRQLPELKSAVQKKLKEYSTAAKVAAASEPAEIVAGRRALHVATQQSLAFELEAIVSEIQFIDGAGDLPTLDRDWHVRQSSAMKKASDQIAELLNRARREEAAAAAAKAEETRLAQTQQHPLLKSAAAQSQAYAKDRTSLAPIIESLEKEVARLKKQLVEVRTKFAAMREKIEPSGVNAATGQELRRVQTDASSTTKWRLDLAAANAEMERLQGTLFDIQAKRSALADLDEHAADLFERDRTAADKRLELERPLESLLTQQKELLDGSILDHQTTLAKLVETAQTLRDLIDETEKFAAFACAETLWLRSTSMLDAASLWNGVRLSGDFFYAGHWKNAGDALLNDAKTNVAMTTWAGLLLMIWVILHHRMRRRLRALGSEVDKNYLTTVGLTFRSLLLTLLMSALTPTLVYYVGWRLANAAEADEFTTAVGAGLQAVALVFATIEVLRQIFRRYGLADSHFRWRSVTVLAVRRNLTLLWPIASGAAFLVAFSEARSNEVWRTSVGRFAFAVGMLSFAYFMHRICNPNGAIIKDAFANRLDGWFYRLRRIWHTAAVGTPAALAVMAVEGHYFTATQLTQRLLPSFWCLIAVVVLNAVAVRWLFAARGKLALDRAKARREMSSGGDPKATAAAMVADQVDLTTVNNDIRRLVGSGLAVSLAVCLWALWSDALPAFGPVTQYELWSVERERMQTTRKPTGETETAKTTEMVRITPLHLMLGLGALWLTFVVAGSLPGLAEVALTSVFPNDAGARYAATTLLRYALSVVGVITVASTIGLGWSQVQWLVAGMTVGLGFGLQEIFANFVSGVILLFERPIRLGDLVTVGDVTGKVTKIRIRAATILDPNRRELIVPNREFITGKVINWTLSDRSSRIQVRVGVPYGTDANLARDLMLQVANDHAEIMRDPAPSALFENFLASSLDMVLNAYVANIDDVTRIRHELNASVAKAFMDAGIDDTSTHRDVTVRLAGDDLENVARSVKKRSA